MGDPEEFSEPDLSQLRGDPTPVTPTGAETGMSAADQRAFRLAHDRLIEISGVVVVGEGLDEIGNAAIHVGVRTAGDLGRIPPALHGLRVLAEVIGEVDALPAVPPRR